MTARALELRDEVLTLVSEVEDSKLLNKIYQLLTPELVVETEPRKRRFSFKAWYDNWLLQRSLRRSMVPAKRKGSYTAICGIWDGDDNEDCDVKEFRKNLWRSKELSW